MRSDFHYDSVVGVLDTSKDATWVIGVDDRGTLVDTSTVKGSVLARWVTIDGG